MFTNTVAPPHKPRVWDLESGEGSIWDEGNEFDYSEMKFVKE